VATNEKVIDAPAERIFEVLSDPESPCECVAGSSRVSVVEYDPHCRLAVEVRRPLSVARLDLELFPQNGGTCVRVVEHTVGGLARPLNNRLLEMVTHIRNARGLDRLARQTEIAS
jgi:carbon monoxide dehydrogenase subunit G